MKKMILKIVFLFFISCSAKAQTLQTYDCPYLQQYEGEWRYTNGLDTIRVYLRKYRTHDIESNYISDRLYGWHEYKHGSAVIESNYQNRFEILPYNIGGPSHIYPTASIYLALIDGCQNNPYEMNGTITDLFLNSRFYNGIMVHIDPNRTTMSWKIWTIGRLASDPQGISYPTDFVLVKQ